MASSPSQVARVASSMFRLSRVPAKLAVRPFHSYGHPPPPGPFNNVEEAILSAAYKHVPEHGFSQKALGLGARDAGYLDISPSVLADGPFSLIRYHLFAQRTALAARSRQLFPDNVSHNGAGARIEALAWERLMGNKDVIHRWQEALAIMAQPSNVPASLKELAMLSDEIWFLSGDTSVDPSWYTKRASLSMIYSTSELFMTNDTSPDFAETSKFLRRRLEEVQSAGNVAGSIGQWVGFTMSAGVNVLRMYQRRMFRAK
ncbi:Ubiquinone biosynthesis protein coq9 [Paramyrothecium foliicola]|nr:Ubiquinone biosynthesis protein coq9 [Paramyrothecium foliicola]